MCGTDARRSAMLVFLTFSTGLPAAAPASLGGHFSMRSPSVEVSEVRADSVAGAHILQNARRLDGDDDYVTVDSSFVAGYSLKFQGCHHISQWNENADEEDEVRILTKRLARFRLCPTGSCSDSKSAGCTSKYGDYIVDMETFVYSLAQAESYSRESKCASYANVCDEMCDGDDGDCEYQCYANGGLAYCLQEGGFDPLNYAQCAQFQFNGNNNVNNYDDDANGRRLNDYADEYYIGPYCADQGGSIHLGLFTDNTCTTFASDWKDTFFLGAGYELPFSSESLVSYDCMSCQAEGDDDYVATSQVCSDMYTASGKCENKMGLDYSNDAACTYIAGVKIIRDDGVIRTHSVRKSKAAAVVIGMFTTLAVLLGAYVFYLRNKLGRAKINLASQG